MKSIGEILNELGFRPDSSLEVQKAFFKHLAQSAEPNTLKSDNNISTKPIKESAQLEFDFSDSKKVS